MMNKRSALLFLVLVIVFLFIFPGAVFAEYASDKYTPSYTVVIKAPEQIEAGQTLTLAAEVRENLYNDVEPNARVYFFVKSDFFISGLVEIGDALTDENGIAKIEYVPNQPGELQIIASYKSVKSLETAEAEGTVNITGSAKPLYSTEIGIRYPNSFIIWVISIVAILCVIWSTFLFVLYQVQNIALRGNGAKGVPFLLIIGVAVMFTVVVLVLVTPEAQYNFGLLP